MGINVLQFVKESKEELRKVEWPTRQQTIQATLVTIFIVGFIAVCLSLLDFIIGNYIWGLFI